MKKLTTKVQKLEAKALRKLHKKSASDNARQANKFREDSLKLGALLCQAGDDVYKHTHPIYAELIQPLLMQAVQIAQKYGFNTLYTTHTPIEGMPNFSHMLGSVDSRTVTPAMKGCIDLINSRPEAKIDTKGKPILTTAETPYANETAIELMAEAIYNQWDEDDEFVAWTPHGNSTRQNEARAIVRAALKPPMPTPEVSESTL